MKYSKVQNLILISIFAAFITVCSWLHIPTAIPFTLQTFAVFVTLGILGGKNGFISICVYVLLGALGVPVFSGFKAGISAIAGATGGYITGFIAGAAVYWLFISFFGKKKEKSMPIMAAGMIFCIITCYLFGTLWFAYVYAGNTGAGGFLSALGVCVVPYIIPDLLKLAAALLLTKKLLPLIKRVIK